MRNLIAAVCSVLLWSSAASAFCGFYVASAEGDLQNSSTHVILMRSGTQTILSMQNDYRGPVEDFAMIVPVPAVLSEDDVKTLPSALFQRVLDLTGPRLVEYWEDDPCNQGEGTIGLGNLGTIGHGGGGGSGYGRGAGRPTVTVEAQFAVGEYDIEILAAEESDGLESWLRAHDYRIPEGASAMLRPYVEAGMKFFVAKVDASRARFEGGRAVLSPLRVNYESETFQLPVRLGMLNSAGSQDLIVNVVAENQRYEVANYPNAFIPTNLDVSNESRDHFSALYDAIFTRTLEANPGAVITEYSWSAGSCDPCPTEALTPTETATLGGDVIARGEGALAVRFQAPTVVAEGSFNSEVITRIMRRYHNQIRSCGQASVGEAPIDHVDYAFTAEADGRITNVAISAEGELGRCMSGAFGRWSFPTESGPTRVSGTFPATMVPVSSFGRGSSYVVTRLHYRYERGGLNEDLVFRAAPPMEGGREAMPSGGELRGGAVPDDVNNFQARYAIRHPWQGEIECDHPQRGVWSGSPPNNRPALAATSVGRTQPGQEIELASFIVNGRGSGLAAAATSAPSATGAPSAQQEDPEGSSAPVESGEAETLAPTSTEAADEGCSTVGGAGSSWLLALVFLWLRRRAF